MLNLYEQMEWNNKGIQSRVWHKMEAEGHIRSLLGPWGSVAPLVSTLITLIHQFNFWQFGTWG